MHRGLDATQLVGPGDWSAVAAWSGLVLIGLAILVTLLDWGDLSGLSRQPPPRRRWAVAFTAAGGGLLAFAAVGVLLPT
jgi:hypothetical protein